jgi:orotidine-5'-phosphate decarboxylase
MKNKIIFVACDASKISKIKDIIIQTKNNKLKIIPKFGLQFFYSKNGRKFLRSLKEIFG